MNNANNIIKNTASSLLIPFCQKHINANIKVANKHIGISNSCVFFFILTGLINAAKPKTNNESFQYRATEEKALQILQKYRTNLAKGGYLDNYLSWLKNRLQGIDDLLF